MDAEDAHEVVIKFTAKKRLELSEKKCSILAINTKKKRMPELVINGTDIKTEQCIKYLGDIINDKGNSGNLVEDRVKKGNACAVNIFSMVQDVTFGVYAVETTLLLYNSIYLSTVLCNSQSWSRLKRKDVGKLQGNQLSFLKRLLHSPKCTPTAILLCELGILPIEYDISKRKLVFLQHILKLDETDPVQKVYFEQLKYSQENNWANEVEHIKRSINMEQDERSIKDMNKSLWKTKVNKAIKVAANIKLNADCDKLKKVKRNYSELKIQEYFMKLPVADARVAFAYRSGTLDIKCFRSYSYNDLKCRACGEDNESIDHIVNKCKTGTRNNECLDLETEDVEIIQTIVTRIKSFLKRTINC